MLRLRLAASLAAAALLSCAGLSPAVQAAEPQQAPSATSARSTLSLERPLLLSEGEATDAAERKVHAEPGPLQSLAERTGMGKTLSEAGITFGGHIQAGWTYNFDDPAFDINVGRVFDFENQDPTLHQIMLFLEKSVAADRFDVGGRMEWMWGGDARLIHSNGLFDDNGVFDGPDEQFDLTQLYLDVNLPVGSGLKIRAGKFITPIGYETIDPTKNALYSRSMLFGFAIPFTHTGILAYYSPSEQLQIFGGITRGWDQSLEDNNGTCDFLGGLAFNFSPETKLYFNTSIGPQQTDNSRDYRYLLDVILTHTLGDNLNLALNADWGWEDIEGTGEVSWCGIAGYANYVINDMFALNGRAEWFNDEDGARGLGTSIFGFTAGVDIKPLVSRRDFSSLRVRPEIRWDISKDDVFDGGQDDNQFTFGVDVLFSF